MTLLREPAVAGQFYLGTKESLAKQVGSLIDPLSAKEDAIGVVSPHAGYIYSGRVAGAVFSSVMAKDHYIIIGPNHTGMGGAFSLSALRTWKTPLGAVAVDGALSEAIAKRSSAIKTDEASHLYEHSIEVQLPFIQYFNRKFKFVPIVASDASLETYRSIGKDIASAVKELKLDGKVLVVASSDMTHYEPQEDAKTKDSVAIKAILELDEEKLLRSVSKFNITMCGYAPVAIMLVLSKELGAGQARLIRYETSGETSGDYSSVVGYAGIIVT